MQYLKTVVVLCELDVTMVERKWGKMLEFSVIFLLFHVGLLFGAALNGEFCIIISNNLNLFSTIKE